LFIAEKETELHDLSVKLCLYNTERQKYCDELYLSAKQKLKEKGAYGNVIMLSDENWNAGFIGIVAARLAEEFKRPTLLFVHNGNLLKGSARSIDNVNIFNMLKACSAYIEEFGGHAQAAGINVHPDKFDDLERALNQEIAAAYTAEDFEQKIYYSEKISAPVSEKFAHELMMIEPCGVGHRRPLFYVTAEKCNAKPLKFASQHLSVRNEFVDLTYFSGLKNLKILTSDVEKQIVFELGVSHFKGREYVKGSVRDILYDGATGKAVSETIFSNAVQRAYATPIGVDAVALTTEEIKNLIAKKREECAYGLCLVASDRRTLRAYEDLENLGCDLFDFSTKNVANTLIVSPAVDVDFSGFKDVVFLDTPSDFNIASLQGRQVFVNKDICGYTMFSSLVTGRDELLEIFSALRREINQLDGNTAEEVAIACGALGFAKRDFIFAINVFKELGLVAFADGRLTVYRGIKADLNDSLIYRKVCALKNA
jgi:ssDNA-specific exonuclease RecJ